MAARSPNGHFIPLRKQELIEVLVREANMSLAQQGQFEQLCQLIDSSIHFHFHKRLERLQSAYAPYDPDAEERPLKANPVSDEADAEDSGRVFSEFESLMERANFRKLTQEEITQAIAGASHLGISLKTNFNVFERLEVYARGDRHSKKKRQRITNKGLRAEEIEIPAYERLALIVRMKSTDSLAGLSMVGKSDKNLPLEESCQRRPIVIKLFKNIPKGDVEMLLPGTSVQMTMFDQGRILVPTVSGLVMTAYKLIQGAVAVAFASMYGLFVFLGLVGGAIGYGISAFFGYSNTRDRYHLSLTRSLYFQNLDNNAGVIMRLLNEAEAQEFREAIIAYWLLWQQGNDDGGWHARQIDLAAEEFLEQRCGLSVDFEVEDALDKLSQANLIRRTSEGGYIAIGMQAAITELDRQWDSAYEAAGVEVEQTTDSAMTPSVSTFADIATPTLQKSSRANLLKILQAA